MKNLKLKAARAGKDLSQQALADRVGVSRQTISAIEKGDYNPTINLCISICKELDVTLNDLFRKKKTSEIKRSQNFFYLFIFSLSLSNSNLAAGEKTWCLFQIRYMLEVRFGSSGRKQSSLSLLVSTRSSNVKA